MTAMRVDYPGERPEFCHRVEVPMPPHGAGSDLFVACRNWLNESPGVTGLYELQWALDKDEINGYPLSHAIYLFTNPTTAVMFKLRFG